MKLKSEFCASPGKEAKEIENSNLIFRNFFFHSFYWFKK